MKERSRSTPTGGWAGDLGRRCHDHRLSPLPQARSHGKKKKKGQDHSAKTRFGENGLTQKKTQQQPWKRLRVFLFTVTEFTLIRALTSCVRHSRPREPTYAALPRPARSPRGLGGRSPQVSPSFLQILLESLSGDHLLSLSQRFRPARPTFRAGGHAACAGCSAWWGAGGGGRRGEGKCARHACVQCPGHGRIPRRAPTHRKPPLGSRFSAALGNLSWAMTRTHLVSMLPDVLWWIRPVLCFGFALLGEALIRRPAPGPCDVSVPNPADKGFFVFRPSECIRLFFLARAKIWKMCQTMMPC